jgi:undecaprenyl-phosphate 4-deoxy-4-formamido-L-arabinose transferase
MPEKSKSCSVVIPVYNGATTLQHLTEQIIPILKKLFNPFEIIFINDGSKDNSWAAICEIETHYPEVYGINLMRNYGQHNATLVGILHAQYNLILTMDDDLQHPPSEITKLYEKLQEGYDVVYGYPIEKAQRAWRNLGSALTRMALKGAMGVENANKITSFRLIRSEVRNAFIDYDSSSVLVDVLLSWGTSNFGFVPVQHQPRKNGTSNYTLKRLIVFAFDMITSFSDWPLKLSSFIGIVFSFLGVIVLLYVLIRYVAVGGSVPGFPFLASIIALFSGAQLLSLGIIGEYISRIHYRTMGRPYFAIRGFSKNKKKSEGK